jgi:hypothetical protein
MDTLTFVERMAGHAIWPLVFLTLLVIYRQAIRQRMTDLRSFKAGPGGFEAQFVEQQVRQVITKATQAMEGENPPTTPEINEDHSRLERMARISPRAAVLESFQLLDRALKRHLAKLGMPGAHEDMRSTPAILLASEHGLVGSTEITVWNDLRDVANTARHLEVPIPIDRAVDYVRVASDLRAKIEDSRPTATSPLTPLSPQASSSRSR